MAALLVWLARCVLVLTLVAAPWAIGGADPPLQRWLMMGVAGAAAIGWLGVLLGGTANISRAAATALALAAGLMAIGAIQLLPHPHLPELPRAQLTGPLGVLTGHDSPAVARSLEPGATRLWMARLAVALSAFLSGAWLFGERRSRHWLWAALAVNGVAVMGFGLVQRASWNGKLYWTIPLELGGQPFAGFVNRNNAAEYLSMCLAAAIGLWATNRSGPPATGSLARSPRVSVPLANRLPGATWGIMILLLFGGVLASLSRGGALSACAGVVVAGLWVGGGRRSRTLLLPLLGIVLAAGVWIGFTNQAAALRARLGALGSSYSTDGRIQHWTDVRGAVLDFPVWGTGFGTYRYANKPYESRRSESWFESADNQYLDILVEGGAPAAGLVVLMLLLAVWIVHSWKRNDSRGEALAGGYLLVAIGLQSVTDCWFGTAANLLTLSTLVGTLSNPGRPSAGARRSALDDVEQLMESRRNYFPSVVIGLCMVAVAGLGAYEVDSAARSTMFRRDVPVGDRRGDWTPQQLDGLIAFGEQLSSQRPGDAELHAALARLWLFRYRLTAVAQLDVVGPDRWKESARWDRTSTAALLGTLARYTQIGDTDSLRRFRDAPAVQEHFEPILRHVRAARRDCPILPNIGYFEAVDALLHEADPSLPLRREAALSPVRVSLLHSLARSAEAIADDTLFTVCLARCIDLSPEQIADFVKTARNRLSEPEIVEQLLPSRPGPLLDFAEQARSAAGKELALERASDLLDDHWPEDGSASFLRGRLLWLRGDRTAAVEQLGIAVFENSLDPERRLLYARALHAEGRIAEARTELQSAQRLLPDDRRNQDRLREVQALLETP